MGVVSPSAAVGRAFVGGIFSFEPPGLKHYGNVAGTFWMDAVYDALAQFIAVNVDVFYFVNVPNLLYAGHLLEMGSQFGNNSGYIGFLFGYGFVVQVNLLAAVTFNPVGLAKRFADYFV